MNPKTTVRIFLDSTLETFVELPRWRVAMSLVNEGEREGDDGYKTTIIPEAWANGDGVEMKVRRIPASTNAASSPVTETFSDLRQCTMIADGVQCILIENHSLLTENGPTGHKFPPFGDGA